VVGAGFAGLAAARELRRLGHDVLVLEGRDRVGGRSHTGHVAGIPVDLGGAFVGPTQDAVLALATELGIRTVPTYHDGANLIRWRGTVRSYRGTVPKLSLTGLFDVGRVRWQFERIARAVPLTWPWTARRAAMWDDQSLGRWLQAVHAGATSRDLLAIMTRVTWGCEPDDVSMLHAARYVRAAGGLDRLLSVEGGAQQDRFIAGTQQIADLSAAELGDRLVLDAAVHHIDCRAGVAAITCAKGGARARFVIVAIPPAHRVGIEFTPALPAELPSTRKTLAAGPAEQGVCRLYQPVLATRWVFWSSAVRRGSGVHHFRRQPAARRTWHPARLRRCPWLRRVTR
jgi:monoamine oxidase